MKRIQYHQYGGPEVMRVEDFEPAPLGTGEVLGVTRLHVGDEVLGGARIKPAGAFAEMVVARESDIVHKPANVSFEDAAAIPTVGLTALQAVIAKGNLQPGQAVFVHSCPGAVGRSAVQIALAHQATVAGSCRDTARSEARDLGVDPDAGGLHGLPVKAARMMLKPGGRIISVLPTPANLLRSALPGPFRAFAAQPRTRDLMTLHRRTRVAPAAVRA